MLNMQEGVELTHYKKIFFSSLFFLTISSPAYAYVDPGTGAYLVQLIVAFLGVGVFYLRHPVKFLKAIWSKIRKTKIDRE